MATSAIQLAHAWHIANSIRIGRFTKAEEPPNGVWKALGVLDHHLKALVFTGKITGCVHELGSIGGDAFLNDNRPGPKAAGFLPVRETFPIQIGMFNAGRISRAEVQVIG